MNSNQKEKLTDALSSPYEFIKETLTEGDEEAKKVKRTAEDFRGLSLTLGNTTDKTRIRYEKKHHAGEASDKLINKKRNDIRRRGNLKGYAGNKFADELSKDEDFGEMYGSISGSTNIYRHFTNVTREAGNKVGYKILGPKLMTAPQRARQRAIRKAQDIAAIPFRTIGSGVRSVGSKLSETKLGRSLVSSSAYRHFRIKAAEGTAKIKQGMSFTSDLLTAPMRNTGKAIDLAKAKALKPIAIAISILLIFQIIIVATTSSSGSSGSVSFLILDTKEHFSSFQNAFDSYEAEFQKQIDSRKNGYADRTNEKGNRIKYGTKYKNGVKLTYDSVTTNNIDDLLTVMAVHMDQSQEEDHERALSVFHDLYHASHTFSYTESPLYYCSGCVKKTETDEEGNRISWWDCYGHVDCEINVHVQAIDELMLTYGFDEQQIDWAYAIRNADDFSKLYNIKSMTESIAGNSGFYIDGIVVNADSKKIPNNGSSMKIVYYPQGSGMEWANVPFGGGNIASSGCSVTSLAMVLSYLKGGDSSDKWIYPNEIVADISKKYGNYNKFYVPPHGQDGNSLFTSMAPYYGLKCSAISSSSIMNALKDGRPVIMSCVPGEFTKQGHFIVLTGITSDGYITVNDPNGSHSDKSYKKYTLNEITNNGKGWWMFWK